MPVISVQQVEAFLMVFLRVSAIMITIPVFVRHSSRLA